MKYLIFIISLVISNLSHSYENNQLLLHNQPKKIGNIEFETLEGDKKKILKKNQIRNYSLSIFGLLGVRHVLRRSQN